MARPTELTPDMSARICDRIRAGAPKKTAALASGISVTTFNTWFRHGEAEDPSSTSIWRKFYDDVEQARAEALQRYVTLHAQNANGYESSRRAPGKWSPTSRNGTKTSAATGSKSASRSR